MRTRMITRNVTLNYTTSLIYDIDEKTTEEEQYVIVGNYNDKELEKILKERLSSVSIKFIAMIKNDTVEQIYGMPEEHFVQYAKPIER